MIGILIAGPNIEWCSDMDEGVSRQQSTYRGYHSPFLPSPLVATIFALFGNSRIFNHLNSANVSEETFHTLYRQLRQPSTDLNLQRHNTSLPPQDEKQVGPSRPFVEKLQIRILSRTLRRNFIRLAGRLLRSEFRYRSS